jgi:hypothetical protein
MSIRLLDVDERLNARLLMRGCLVFWRWRWRW